MLSLLESLRVTLVAYFLNLHFKYSELILLKIRFFSFPTSSLTCLFLKSLEPLAHQYLLNLSLRSEWLVDQDPLASGFAQVRRLAKTPLSLSLRSGWYVDQNRFSLSLRSRRKVHQYVLSVSLRSRG